MAVQQGIVRPELLAIELLRVRRDRRRRLVNVVLLDLLAGAGSLGELEFAQVEEALSSAGWVRSA
jgi:hypothetical protein